MTVSTDPTTPATDTNEARIRRACDHLREARDLLRAAGAPRATDKVRKALKSAEGAERNASVRRWKDEAAQ